MEKQTMERVDLYQQRDSPGPPLIINVGLLTGEIWDDTPTNGEIQTAVAELTNGRSVGASRMRAEHLKEWLKGAKSEEDPETGPNNVGAGDKWNALIQLIQAFWDEGKIPIQLGWGGSSQSSSQKEVEITPASASLSQSGRSSNM